MSGGSTATVTAVSAVNGPNGTTYDVTVSGGNLATYTGNVGLDLRATQNITDISGTLDQVLAAEPAIDETYAESNVSLSGVWLAIGGDSLARIVQNGSVLTMTNERGTQVIGNLSTDGRQITVSSWNLVADIDFTSNDGRIVFRENKSVWVRLLVTGQKACHCGGAPLVGYTGTLVLNVIQPKRVNRRCRR